MTGVDAGVATHSAFPPRCPCPCGVALLHTPRRVPTSSAVVFVRRQREASRVGLGSPQSLRAISMAATVFIGCWACAASRSDAARRGRTPPRPASQGDQPCVIEDALVVRRHDRVRAFSLRCPHLGCRLAILIPDARSDVSVPRKPLLSGPETESRVRGRGLSELEVELTSS